jgi:YegS/Rv2252/BmrU family lipid kinase
MKRLTVIHNPGSGSQAEDELASIVALLAPHFEVETLEVSEHRDPVTLAKAAVANGVDVLVASGGDGTVSAAASVLVGRDDIVLGIIPRGTGNSIATSLGVPVGRDEACAVIIAGNTHVIDTATVAGRTMVLMACVGLHADAITETPDEAKQAFGKLAYAFKGLTLSASSTPFEIFIGTDDAAIRCEASAVTVANLAPATTFLARGPGEPHADDGLLAVTLVSVTGLAETLLTGMHLATRALAGLPADRENVAHFRVSRIRVQTAEPMPVMVDGEQVGTTPFEVVCVPRSLSVLVPAEAPSEA